MIKMQAQAFSVFVLVLSLQPLHATEAIREVSSQAILAPLQAIPAFYNGYVYFIDDPNNSSARVYAPDGHLAFTTRIPDKKTQAARLHNLAIDHDGTVAASWVSGDATAGSAGIDFFDKTGRQTLSIDTATYVPAHIAYGEDHSLWTFGWQLRPRIDVYQQDFMTIRRFSREGKQTGAWLPRSSFPQGLYPAGGAWEVTRITAAKDRIGVLATAGRFGSAQEWIELDLRGNLIGRWPLNDANLAPVGMTTDGHVYVQKGNGPSVAEFFTLDRAASIWKPVRAPTADRFYGTDGDQLVFAGWKPGPMQVRWFHQ